MADVPIVSFRFAVPITSCCLQRSCVPMHAVTHTIDFDVFVLDTNVSNPKILSNSNARTDMMGPIVEFSSIR